MKKIIILILMLIFSVGIFAQKHTLKGRAFKASYFFTLGIGYERMVSDNFSVQILFNRYGIDRRNHDGGADFTNSLVPEVRYYLGKKENKKVFLGVFSEVSKTKSFTSGAPELLLNPKILKKSHTNIFASGVLIGLNNGTRKKWIFELYVGGKYKFAIETNEYFVSQEIVIEKKDISRFGIRAGVNVGFRF